MVGLHNARLQQQVLSEDSRRATHSKSLHTQIAQEVRNTFIDLVDTGS